MNNPTQLVISEQARAAASTIEHAYCLELESYNFVQVTIQLLLNSQREAIIRECAEAAEQAGDKIGDVNFQAGVCEAQQAILAKLMNK